MISGTYSDVTLSRQFDRNELTGDGTQDLVFWGYGIGGGAYNGGAVHVLDYAIADSPDFTALAIPLEGTEASRSWSG